MKTCTKCKISKDLSSFHKNCASSDGLSFKCKTCRASQASEYWKNKEKKQMSKDQKDRKAIYDKNYRFINKEIIQKKDRDKALKRNFGISLEIKKSMFEDQSGKCATCMDDLPSMTKANVDHDHKTGSVRKLLCTSCNLLLGQYEKILRKDLLITFNKYLGDYQ